MLFNSYIFVLLFLPITVSGYFLLNRFNYQISKIYLIGMSLWFYAYFNIKYLPIILLSIVLNYVLSILFRIKFMKQIRVCLLLIGIFGNLGVLFYFKYYNFFIENINLVFKSSFNLHHLILPLGISFFTFQQLSYIIDSYKEKVPNYTFFDYSLFVIFFPQLIAGPIITHDEIIPQFSDKNKKKFDYRNMSKGIFAFALGLGKKVLIADILGKVVNLGFGTTDFLDTTNTIIVMFCYTLQIYFDFSGYCDMATGIGLMFNIDIPMNFNSPYRSLTIIDFWKRWHITLTRFFTRYIYLPLGGNRKGSLCTYINIFVVFFISGFWHGANWTFLVWGIMHGIANIITRLLQGKISRLHSAFMWFINFSFISITWVFFRADNVKQALLFLNRLFRLDFQPINEDIINCFFMPELKIFSEATGIGFIGNSFFIMVIWITFAMIAVLTMKNTNERIATFQPNVFSSGITMVLLVWSIISFAGVSTFLYFNF